MEFVVKMSRVDDGSVLGRRSVICSNSSAVVVEAGNGRHTVGGRERPGKVSSRTLIVDAIFADSDWRGSRLCTPRR